MSGLDELFPDEASLVRGVTIFDLIEMYGMIIRIMERKQEITPEALSHLEKLSESLRKAIDDCVQQLSLKEASDVP